MAEVTLGAGKGKKGVVLVITIGTGIGTGLFYNGKLIPNLEIGKLLHKDGEIIEFFCADSIRKKEELTLEEWALRFDILLQYIKTIFSPNLIILGGGISKKYDKFKQYLNTDVKIKVAKFKNNAGIIGAAMYASKKINKYASISKNLNVIAKEEIYRQDKSNNQPIFKSINFSKNLSNLDDIVKRVDFFSKQILNNSKTNIFQVTDKNMTRFNITINQAVEFVMKCLKNMKGKEIFVPKISSYRLIDLVKAFSNKPKIKIIGIRPGEKIHEEMVSVYDSPNTLNCRDFFVIYPNELEKSKAKKI